ncbi:MAG: hypothetical protein WC565_06915 [Parcubacteria group bacterium]
MRYFKWRLEGEAWRLWRSQMVGSELRWYDTDFAVRRTISGREYFIERQHGDDVLGFRRLKDAQQKAEQLAEGGEK